MEHLDIDDLKDISQLERWVEASDVFVVILTAGYFKSGAPRAAP